MSRWNQYFTAERFLDDGIRTNFNAHYKKPSILILEENIPKPDKDSGSRRLFEIIKILQKRVI